jgi:hypothetical protein
MNSVGYDPMGDVINQQKVFARFFATLKEYCDKGLTKVFMTGIIPIVLSHMTSGFNIAEYLHNLETFLRMNGFLKEDVKRGLEFIRPKLKPEEVGSINIFG